MFNTPRQAVPFAKGNTAQQGKKRGPKYFRYTFQQVADASGLKVGTLHNKKHAQPLRQIAEEGDLKKLILFIYERTWHRKVSSAELKERYGKTAASDWRRRYPRFNLYHCPDCTTWVMAKARCLAHGGQTALLMGRSTGEIKLLVESEAGELRYESYARLVAGATGLETVKHLDGNRWNNRASNLQVCKAAPPDLLWPMHCPTCAELYGSAAPAALSCSNAFHMCRDCTWKNGTLLKQCITCEDADHVDATPGETDE